ncbi:hypothetical protein Cgig2_004448 [Carnegiea gigantea]|uniref:Uncharacterized protein n=1 Tax=Carnegiea gigantea TaxID=171969 RepID=A0A9Q1Q7V5_9CARY|nr:hypothetical protein Cgig2_004448 [Carnegiea gigantea]
MVDDTKLWEIRTRVPTETLLKAGAESAANDFTEPSAVSTAYILFLPVLDGQFRTSLEGSNDDQLQICPAKNLELEQGNWDDGGCFQLSRSRKLANSRKPSRPNAVHAFNSGYEPGGKDQRKRLWTCGRFGTYSSQPSKACRVDAQLESFTNNSIDGLLMPELDGNVTQKRLRLNALFCQLRSRTRAYEL